MRKFGRRRPDPARVERQPRFAKYRTTSPLVVPDAWDFSALCPEALATMLANGPDPSVTIDPYAKDNGLGDCTCAAPCHGVAIWTAGGGTPAVVTSDQAIRLYSLSCGYQIGNEATDQGGDELAVLDYIQQHGIDGKGLHQIAGTASLEATNIQELREGIFLTGAAELCLELPNAYVNPFPSGETVWDIAGPPNDQQGHCVLACGGFTTNGPNGKPAFRIDTWGETEVWMTTDAVAYYCSARQGGSANLALTKEWVSKAKGTAPNALDFAGLASEFEQIGGQVSS